MTRLPRTVEVTWPWYDRLACVLALLIMAAGIAFAPGIMAEGDPVRVWAWRAAIALGGVALAGSLTTITIRRTIDGGTCDDDPDDQGPIGGSAGA